MAEQKDRLVVVESVYHQPVGKEAKLIASRFSRELSSDEQPYQRELKASERWEPLDNGWIDKAGMLVIRNNEGQFLQTQPTEEERQEVAERVLEICCEDRDALSVDNDFPISLFPQWWILPGESMRACPADLGSIYIRCRSGTAQFTLDLLPR